MIVKCSKEWLRDLIIILFLGVICLIAGILKFGFSQIGISYIVIVSFILCLYTLQTLVTISRTFIFDKDGITIKLMYFSKTYKWKDLKTKRIEDYSHRMRINHPYIKAAVFSPNNIKNPFRLYPLYYSLFAVLFTNPFKYVFVYFNPYAERKRSPRDFPYTYLVDESEFREKILEWNVDIENF